MGVGMIRALASAAIFAALFLGAMAAPGYSETQSELSKLINSGTWKIYATEKAGFVNLTLSYSATLSNSAGIVPLAAMGMQVEELAGEHSVQFRFPTDAGDFMCQGDAANGNGNGTFVFVPDAAYARAYDAAHPARITPRQQVQAGIFDLSIDFVRAVAAAGFADTPFETLLGMKMFGVTPEFLKALHADFPTADSSEVVGMWMFVDKEHADVHALHLDFPTESLDAVAALAAAGVTPAYVAALRSADVHDISAESVAVLRANGVEQAFLDHLAANGPRGLSVEDVVRLKKAAP
jgi:hypothetical protein